METRERTVVVQSRQQCSCLHCHVRLWSRLPQTATENNGISDKREEKN